MYSFDVFDTLITRMTATPYGIFAIMGQHIKEDEAYRDLSPHIRDNFYTLRIQAEKVARFHNETEGLEEVTLWDIYRALSMAGDMDSAMQDRLCRLEQEVERTNVLPVPENIEKLMQYMTKGEQVVLLSDMYLPKETIQEMLVKADERLGKVPLYVSSDLCAKKTTGELYRRVKEIEDVEYQDWTHIGDDQVQDIEIPRRLGIQTVHVKNEAFMTHETRFLKRFSDNAALQLLIGQARYTRRVDHLKTTAERMGSSICGPLIYCYVDWILKECMRKGIKRLYFIARDGYLPKIIADKLIKDRDLPIMSHYLYGSRKAWRMCSLREEHFDLVRSVAWSYPEKMKTTARLAQALEIAVDQLAPFLPYGSREAETELSPQALCYIVKKLEKSKGFRKFYLDHKKKERELAVRYLREQIDTEDGLFAFVDASGTGLNQGCLHQLMIDFYEKPIHSFFFRMDKVNMAEGCAYHVFFPNDPQDRLMAEMLFRAPHGQTEGYEQKDGKIVPVLGDHEDDHLIQHGFLRQQKAIEAFTERMLKVEKSNPLFSGSLIVVEAYFQYMAAEPDKETLEYFSTFPDDETGQRGSFLEYAPRLTKEDILNIFVRKMYWENDRDYYEGSDLAYSLLRCSKEEQRLVQKCKKGYETEWGRKERAEKILKEQELVKKYGRAAYYPCELLEKDIILYGAGKFGRELHKKILDLGIGRTIKWVDKKVAKNKRTLVSYPDEVDTVEGIEGLKFEQIVIAVLDEKVACEIQYGLVSKGIPAEKIFWVPVYFDRNMRYDWKEK